MVFKVEGEKFFIPLSDIKAVDFSNTDTKAYRKFKEAQANADTCAQGVQDATYLHGKQGLHILYGFLFGPFAVAGAAIAGPSPSTSKSTRMHSSNKDLFTDIDYLQCYKKKARGKNVANAAIGWGTLIPLSLVLSE